MWTITTIPAEAVTTSLACMTRRILALVLGMLYIRISRLTACHKDVGHNYKQVDAYIDANHAYPPLDEAWVFPVAATTSASPMPPQNLTPEQLKKDALPWTPSSVSSASTSAAQNAPVNQSKDVQQIANELNQKITQPITPNAQNASPASAPKAQATTTASTPAKSTAQ